ncbi:MAG: hypothetical protein IPK70_13600 [Flavobacteriales bacterium]|jgi:antitoxin component YwqK of YwqJK toxin-antitoxin module|nr:hypothetical protein [Flavobacteriales bacterium]
MRGIAFFFVFMIMGGSLSAQRAELLVQERYPDGTLRATRYREGDRVRFITYHENGRVKEMGGFRDGRRDGEWKQFSDTGAVLAHASFRNGLRQGVWEFRSHRNSVVCRLVYSEGVIQRGEQYDERGELVAMRDY